jgi:hypothetical protein
VSSPSIGGPSASLALAFLGAVACTTLIGVNDLEKVVCIGNCGSDAATLLSSDSKAPVGPGSSPPDAFALPSGATDATSETPLPQVDGDGVSTGDGSTRDAPEVDASEVDASEVDASTTCGPATARRCDAYSGIFALGTRGTTASCVTAKDPTLVYGSEVYQWSCSGAPTQLFRIETVGPGIYRFAVANTQKCITLPPLTSPPAGVAPDPVIGACHGARKEQFNVVDIGGGKVNIVNPQRGACLDVYNATSSNGARMQGTACDGGVSQAFKLVYVSP